MITAKEFEEKEGKWNGKLYGKDGNIVYKNGEKYILKDPENLTEKLTDETMFNNLIKSGESKANAYKFLAQKKAEKLLAAKGFEIGGLIVRKDIDKFNSIVVNLDTFKAYKIYDNFYENVKKREEVDIYSLF